MSRHRGLPRATLSTDTHLQSPRKDMLRQHFAKFHNAHPLRPTSSLLTPSSWTNHPVILNLFQDPVSASLDSGSSPECSGGHEHAFRRRPGVRSGNSAHRKGTVRRFGVRSGNSAHRKGTVRRFGVRSGNFAHHKAKVRASGGPVCRVEGGVLKMWIG